MSCADDIKLSHQKSLIDYFCKKMNKEHARIFALFQYFYDILLKYTVTSNVEVVIRSRDMSSLLVAIYLFFTLFYFSILSTLY